ncbi:MAG: hypothetical protein M5U22_07205 [Thermoleophilia bacterium]|nr:hypothetical protein [Thermoleophilia bacterium]
MSGKKRRLEKIEASLTPQQAVLLWMEEAHKFGSLMDYARWLVEQPEECYPLIKVPGQVQQALRAAMKGRSPEEIHQKIRSAERDVLLCYFLIKDLNLRALELTDSLRLKSLILHEQLRGLLTRQALAEDMAAHCPLCQHGVRHSEAQELLNL